VSLKAGLAGLTGNLTRPTRFSAGKWMIFTGASQTIRSGTTLLELSLQNPGGLSWYGIYKPRRAHCICIYNDNYLMRNRLPRQWGSHEYGGVIRQGRHLHPPPRYLHKKTSFGRLCGELASVVSDNAVTTTSEK
jgi:hypothetical protein